MKRKGIITDDILNKIDILNENESYNPYKAIRKNKIDESKLFNKDNYNVDDEDKYTNSIVGYKKYNKIGLLVGVILH